MQVGNKSNKYVKETKINVVHLITFYDLNFSVIMCLYPLCLQTCKITILSAALIFYALKYKKVSFMYSSSFYVHSDPVVIAYINACLIEYSESSSFHLIFTSGWNLIWFTLVTWFRLWFNGNLASYIVSVATQTAMKLCFRTTNGIFCGRITYCFRMSHAFPSMFSIHNFLYW